MDDQPAHEILTAAYRALCEHGYADLTLRHVAAESDRSKATIHYHYDSKDELFGAVLEHLYEEYTAAIYSVSGTTSHEHLRSLLRTLLVDDGSDRSGFRTATLEMKAQAPYDESVRGQLRRFDDFLFRHLEDVIREGVDCGEFDDSIDPAREAELLTTTVEGARTRRATADRSTDRLYGTVDEYVETQILADDATNGSGDSEVPD